MTRSTHMKCFEDILFFIKLGNKICRRYGDVECPGTGDLELLPFISQNQPDINELREEGMGD